MKLKKMLAVALLAMSAMGFQNCQCTVVVTF